MTNRRPVPKSLLSHEAYCNFCGVIEPVRVINTIYGMIKVPPKYWTSHDGLLYCCDKHRGYGMRGLYVMDGAE